MGITGLISPDKYQVNRRICRRQRLSGPEVLRPVFIPVWKGRLGFTSNTGEADAAYIGCQTLAHGCVLTVSSASGFPALLERIPE